MTHPTASGRGIWKEENEYQLRNLRFLNPFPICGDPVASYRELQNKTMTDVSILIVCWNSDKFIFECLNSIYHYTKELSVEVIIVDNGSDDKTVEIIQHNYPNIKLIKAGVNLGFARANNLALSFAQGQYIFLLNPDTRFKSDVIGELVRFLKEHPIAGCVGPKILEKNGKVSSFQVRQPPSLSGTAYTQFGLRKLFPQSHIFAKEYLPDLDRQAIREVPSMNGAALMIPRAVFHQVGDLDEQIPMYFEDLDICARIRALGKHIFFVPSAELVHLGGMSSELSPVRPLLYAMENGQAPWLYFRKYGRTLDPLIFTLIILTSNLIRLPLFLLSYLGRIKMPTLCDQMRRNITKSWALVRWSLSNKKSFSKRLSGVFYDIVNDKKKDNAFHSHDVKEKILFLASMKKTKPERSQ